MSTKHSAKIKTVICNTVIKIIPNYLAHWQIMLIFASMFEKEIERYEHIRAEFQEKVRHTQSDNSLQMMFFRQNFRIFAAKTEMI